LLILYVIPDKKENNTGRYSLFFTSYYFSGLLLWNASKALSKFIDRSHTAIRDWIQRYKPEKLLFRKINIAEFVVDKTK
jgi:hypothetical protein